MTLSCANPTSPCAQLTVDAHGHGDLVLRSNLTMATATSDPASKSGVPAGSGAQPSAGWQVPVAGFEKAGLDAGCIAEDEVSDAHIKVQLPRQPPSTSSIQLAARVLSRPGESFLNSSVESRKAIRPVIVRKEQSQASKI